MVNNYDNNLLTLNRPFMNYSFVGFRTVPLTQFNFGFAFSRMHWGFVIQKVHSIGGVAHYFMMPPDLFMVGPVSINSL